MRLPPWARGPARRLGAEAGATVLRAGTASLRWRHVHAERESRLLETDRCVIYAGWHGRMLVLAGGLRRPGTGVLVSLSPDGEVIAQVLERLGFRAVRGSSSRRGSEGLRELEAWLARGRSAAITPDGPRGPRHRAQMGTVVLAARSGRAILPLGGAARPAWTLGSWDRFQIPRPWARAALVFGEPLRVPPGETDLEPWRARLEAALDAAEREAEQVVEQ